MAARISSSGILAMAGGLSLVIPGKQACWPVVRMGAKSVARWWESRPYSESSKRTRGGNFIAFFAILHSCRMALRKSRCSTYGLIEVMGKRRDPAQSRQTVAQKAMRWGEQTGSEQSYHGITHEVWDTLNRSKPMGSWPPLTALTFARSRSGLRFFLLGLFDFFFVSVVAFGHSDEVGSSSGSHTPFPAFCKQRLSNLFFLSKRRTRWPPSSHAFLPQICAKWWARRNFCATGVLITKG